MRRVRQLANSTPRASPIAALSGFPIRTRPSRVYSGSLKSLLMVQAPEAGAGEGSEMTSLVSLSITLEPLPAVKPQVTQRVSLMLYSTSKADQDLNSRPLRNALLNSFLGRPQWAFRSSTTLADSKSQSHRFLGRRHDYYRQPGRARRLSLQPRMGNS